MADHRRRRPRRGRSVRRARAADGTGALEPHHRRGNGVSAAAQPRTRAFSWEDPAAAEASALRMSGLEYLQAIIDGQLPPPPFARALEAELLEVQAGRALFAAEPAEWM